MALNSMGYEFILFDVQQVVYNALCLLGCYTFGNYFLLLVQNKKLRVALQIVKAAEFVAVGTPAIDPVIELVFVHEIYPLSLCLPPCL